MDRQELLSALEEGLTNGRISRHTAAYIAAEILGISAEETGYFDDDWALRAAEAANRSAEQEMEFEAVAA